MAYHPLDINPKTPAKVNHFIHGHLDMLVHDIHCMLRLPMPARGLRAGCNFAAATYLLDLIGGVSTALYWKGGRSGARFQDVLLKYYPWDMEPTGGLDAATGSKTLYKIFRNPLVHALGLGKERIAIARSGLSERVLGKLELSLTRPHAGSARATIIEDPTDNRKHLLVDGLYWGFRRMVRRLTDDHELMADVAKQLP
jgi:hypothetical protein